MKEDNTLNKEEKLIVEERLKDIKKNNIISTEELRKHLFDNFEIQKIPETEEVELLRVYKKGNYYYYKIGEDTSKFEVYGLLETFVIPNMMEDNIR